ncbi:hypothetical protein B0J18DRAFT_470015 [Chaetomium sp. MPI-SDFR-AT-0129]|nr:hypothetical protein B0J18DRAFT_470015 [Chaetomium sp. MPI-SDFR-AT-0129]
MGVVTWKDISTSKVYRFLIGPSKREFTVHSAVVEKQSKVLNTFVNNTAFREANDGCAELTEVDEEVFTSFVQYAYTGDYDFPDYGLDPVAKATIAAARETSEKLMAARGALKKKRLKASDEPPSESSEPAADNGSFYWRNMYQTPNPPGASDTASTSDQTADTARPLLHHARLYVFADCYQISRLAQIAHDNLEKQLGALKQKPFDRISVDVTITLLAYAYQEPRPKALRSLLVQDVSRKVDKLWIYGSFREILEAHAELGAELVGEMVKRLRSS